MNPPQSQYQTGVVTEVLSETKLPADQTQQSWYLQEVSVRPQQTTQDVSLSAGSEFQPLTEAQRLKPGDQVVLTLTANPETEVSHVISDVYRLPALSWLGLGFLTLVVVIGKWRGLASMIGLALSLAVLFRYVLPGILAGESPLWLSISGAGVISAVTMYLSHGFNRKSHIALGSLLVTLLGVIGLSVVSVQIAHLVGLGSEEAAFLQYGDHAAINLQGLLLGGMVLGALGVLDDIVVSQVSVVQQLKRANPKLAFDQLFARSLEVGKDHVASLVNTLALAYAGANLPLFLLFYQSSEIPWWVILNNELIAEEVVRTLVGSIGLVLAVPITSLAASFIFNRLSPAAVKKLTAEGHQH